MLKRCWKRFCGLCDLLSFQAWRALLKMLKLHSKPCLLLPLLLATFISAYSTLSNTTLGFLPRGSHDLNPHTGHILAPLLIPRVPGTSGSSQVQQHIISFSASHLSAWTITFDSFTANNPATNGKDVPFVNIIARRDPPGVFKGNISRLTLAAHYDSWSLLEGFIGASDSVASCAILMHVARSVDEALSRKWTAASGNGRVSEQGIQIIFFDGEEGFGRGWNDYDFFYGSKHLAAKWENTSNPPGSTYPTELSSIALFVLLDLLGAPNPKIPSYFPSTHIFYEKLADIESRMRSLHLLHSHPSKPFLSDSKPHFDIQGPIPGKGVLDDHIAFLDRGVKVLHLIPEEFPTVWHTIDDDGGDLDMETVGDWAVIMVAFVGEWMELEVWFGEGDEDGRVEV